MQVSAVQKFANRHPTVPVKVSTINEFIILDKDILVDDKYGVLIGTALVDGREVEKFINIESITAISTLIIEEEDSTE